MEIKRGNYAEGNIQSVMLTNGDSAVITAGIMLKGTYNLGKADPRELMNVTSGEIIINGTKCTADSAAKVIEVGEEIIFEVIQDATYTCTYG